MRAYEPASEHADLVPVYPASEDVTPKKLRELVLAALPRDVADPLPAALGQREAAVRRSTRSTRCTGRVRSRRPNAARARLAFDELLVLQLGIARTRTRARGDGRAGARRAAES